MIELFGINKQKEILLPEIKMAIENVLAHGRFLNGPEIAKLQEVIKNYTKAKEAIFCGSGTDALILALLALDFPKDSAVIVPAFSYGATANAVLMANLNLVFCDISYSSFNISEQSLLQAISLAKSKGYNTKAIIAVDLFGTVCNYQALAKIANKHNLEIIADCAQSFGSQYYNSKLKKQLKTGNTAKLSTFSFYPTKTLSSYGDAGMVLTNSSKLKEKICNIQQNGNSNNALPTKYKGFNARGDSIQAAILLSKFKLIRSEISSRHKSAKIYDKLLKPLIDKNFITLQKSLEKSRTCKSLYSILVHNNKRSGLMKYLANKSIETKIYYTKALTDQPAFRHALKTEIVNSKKIASEVLSLPFHPYIETNEIKEVVDNIKFFFKI